jgi:glutamine synthetase
MKRKELENLLKSGEFQWLTLVFSDIAGNKKQLILPPWRFSEIMEHGVEVDRSDIEGFLSICEDGYRLMPEAGILRKAIDESTGSAYLMILCTVHDNDGSDVLNGASRILEEVYRNAKKLGFSGMNKNELDRFLFRRNSEVTPIFV